MELEIHRITVHFAAVVLLLKMTIFHLTDTICDRLKFIDATITVDLRMAWWELQTGKYVGIATQSPTSREVTHVTFTN